MKQKNIVRNQIFLFAFALFCFAMPFREVLYDNVLSRLDLAYSLALRNTTRIDEFHANTLDKAFVNGHFYCDKAPGMSFAGAVVLKAARRFVSPERMRPENKSLHYLLTILLIAVPSAAAVALLYRMALSLSGNSAASMLAAISWAAGTAALPYSTLFMEHQFAANLMLFVVFLLFPAFRGEAVSSIKLLFSGLLMGWAAISEYPSAVSAAAVMLILFIAMRHRWKISLLLPGLAACAALLAVYNSVSFGSPLTIGYHNEVVGYYREGMGAGIMGVTAPKPIQLLSILFLPERGLFWMSPFLLAGVFGFRELLRREGDRAIGILCLSVALARIIVVSGYYEPWGGFSFGSRFVTGALPFLALPVAAAWTKMGKTGRLLTSALCLFSVAQCLFISAVEPRAPFTIRHPLFEYAFALARDGFEPASILKMLSVGFFAAWGAAAIVLVLFFVRFIRSAGGHAGEYVLPGTSGAALLAALYFALAAALPSPGIEYTEYYRGVALRQNGKFPAAEKRLTKAAELAQKPFPAARFALGITQVRLEKYDDAEANFRLAVRDGFPGTQARVSLCALLIMRGKYEEAESALVEGLAAFPDSPELNDLMKNLQAKDSPRRH